MHEADVLRHRGHLTDAGKRRVPVRINQTGHDGAAAAIDHLRRFGPLPRRRQTGDAAVLDEDIDARADRQRLAIEKPQVREKDRTPRRLGAQLARREPEACEHADHCRHPAQHLTA